MHRPLLALVASAILVVIAAPTARQSPEQDLIAAEREWARAMVEKDLEALDELYADDLTYVHGSGTVETKAAFLAKLSDGSRTYHRIETLEPQARVIGDGGVVTDLLDVEVEAGGDRFTVRVRTVNVFARRDGSWQIVVHQATRLAAP